MIAVLERTDRRDGKLVGGVVAAGILTQCVLEAIRATWGRIGLGESWERWFSAPFHTKI